jgi:hypothetical protein
MPDDRAGADDPCDPWVIDGFSTEQQRPASAAKITARKS